MVVGLWGCVVVGLSAGDGSLAGLWVAWGVGALCGVAVLGSVGCVGLWGCGAVWLWSCRAAGLRGCGAVGLELWGRGVAVRLCLHAFRSKNLLFRV